MTTAAEKWRDDLASWAIPDEIRAQAPQDPWIHPVAQFLAPDGPIPDSPAHAVARDVLPAGGSVLDIGCGGGRAALALVPPAALLIGVDHQQGMLDAFAEAAAKRGVASEGILGLRACAHRACTSPHRARAPGAPSAQLDEPAVEAILGSRSAGLPHR